MKKTTSVDNEVIRLLHDIKDAERNIKDSKKLGDSVKRLIKMHDEEQAHKESQMLPD